VTIKQVTVFMRYGLNLGRKIFLKMKSMKWCSALQKAWKRTQLP